MKDIINTDQTGKLPQNSSQGKIYHMIVHDIDSNSTWVEPIKDITEREMMIGRTQKLKLTKLCGILTKHQV